MSTGFATYPGGKGANQAVAAARLGASVSMVGAVGGDDFGSRLIDGLVSDGIGTGSVMVMAGVPTGMAMIAVDDGGENAITVVPGANGAFGPERAAAGLRAAAAAEAGGSSGGRFALFQLEIPADAVLAAMVQGRSLGMKIMLDPAPAPTPATPLPENFLQQVDVLVPNLGEARALIGDGSATPEACARTLAAMGIPLVAVTLGARGVVWAEGENPRHVHHEPARPAAAVDSTAAGDSFAGALAVALAEGEEPPRAIDFAQAAAAITVTRRGAQPSLPGRAEVAAALQQS